MEDLNETIDGVEEGRISPEKGQALAFLSLAKSARNYLEFLGCNAHPGGHLDVYVQNIVDVLDKIASAISDVAE